MKRKFLISILALIFVIALCVSIVMLVQHLTKKPKLSSLSVEECVAYMEAHGVHIPKKLQDDLPALIAKIEENPYRGPAYGSYLLNKYEDQVRLVVAEYYGLEGVETVKSIWDSREQEEYEHFIESLDK